MGPTGPRAGPRAGRVGAADARREPPLASRLVVTAMLSRSDSSSNFSWAPMRKPHLCLVRLTCSSTEAGISLKRDTGVRQATQRRH